MRTFPLLAATAILAAVLSPLSSAYGQPTRNDLLQNIRDVETLDPSVEQLLPRWKILEADLKIKLAQIFQLDGKSVSASDTFVVTATFPKNGSQDLLVVRVNDQLLINPSISGTSTIREYLGANLYQEILARNYAYQAIPPATPITESGPERTYSVLYPTNSRQFIAISAFRQAVQIGTTGARIEHWIGTDEIGYHFWSSGQGKVFLNYPIIRLNDPDLRAKGVPDILTLNVGAAYRLKFGEVGNDGLSGLVAPRNLNGSLGGKILGHIDYRLPEANNFGFFFHAEVPFSRRDTATVSRTGVTILKELKARPSILDSFNYNGYFLRNVVQGAVFYEDWLNAYEHFFRISLGISYQDVLRMTNKTKDETSLDLSLEPSQLYHPSEVQDWLYAKVEYLNQAGSPFGASAQLSNQNLLIQGFFPVIANWLFIELKYSTPLLRNNAEPWERSSFFMASPILRFDISGASR